jgi:hypothetical protein
MSRYARVVWPSAVMLAAFAVRFLTLGAFENDHFVILARAVQMHAGDWPVADFVDPGMPLSYGVSAAALLFTDAPLLTDAVVSVAMFAVATGIAFMLARRAGGTALAVAAVAMILAIPPRLYSTPKVFVHTVAIGLAWRYADRPSLARLTALAAWTVVAFLFRHDFAVYVATAALALFPVRHREGDLIRTVVSYLIACTCFAVPWLLYVQQVQGLDGYFQSAWRFSTAEAARTVEAWPASFYAVTAIGVAALALAVRAIGTLSPSHIVFAAVLTLAIDVAFLRDAAGARIGDVVAPTAVLAAWIASRLPPRLAQTSGAIAVLVSVAAGGLYFVQRGFGVPTPAGVFRQAARVAERLRTASPEVLPDGRLAPLVAYIRRCTPADERVLVTGFGPQLPVLSQRRFAGGLPSFVPGYYVSTDDVRRARAQLERERVGIVVSLEGAAVTAEEWPAIAAHFRDRDFQQFPMRAVGPTVDVWLPPGRTGAPDAETGLPCPASF